MAWLDEEVSAQFARWEERGRGWRVWPAPVEIEPPFVPFRGYAPNTSQFVDDGKRPSRIASALTKIGLLVSPVPAAPTPEPELEPEPQALERSDLIELQLSPPPQQSFKMPDMAPLLRQLGLCREPVGFEIVGTGERTIVQFVAHAGDAPMLQRQLQAHFPDVVVIEQQDTLASAWASAESSESLVVEFGLAREFAFPLAKVNADPFVGLVAALETVVPGEAALFQVLFQSVEQPWADSLLRAVTTNDGRPLFQDTPQLTQLAQEKITSPLFAVVVRIAIQTEDYDRTLEIARDMAGALRQFARLDGNELIPLENREYPFEEHLTDVVCRQSRRSGMLLNTEELIGFVHLPTAAVRATKLQRDVAKTKTAPKAATQRQDGLLLGFNSHAGITNEVRLSPEERSKHMHMGRGGGQHKAIQQRLKEGAEMLGFRSTIEKPVLDGKGSVDLLLERAGDAIAVEISFSTTIDHEFCNVEKCVKAGYHHIAVISTDEKRLRDIEAAVTGGLGKEIAARAKYFSPDAFLEHLRSLPVSPATPALPTEATVRGYKVRRHSSKLTPEEQKQREDAAVKMLAETMRKRTR